MLACLYHAPEIGEATGTATIGSSEAAMLGLLAHKWSWKKRRQAEGNSFERPNVVFGADVHCCWEKFAKYFDVEMRKIPLETGRYTITAGEVEKRIDENTICVGAVLGTTFTGQVDPVKEIDELLERIRNERGWDIPIHVDAASGGFIAPFAYPDLQWDFRLGRVKSINTSGHKYGLVYPGVGWLIFRDKQDLPEELIFSVNYLGENMPTYTLNFSSGSSMVLGRYYNFLRLGRKGYREVVNIVLENARYLAEQLQATGRFELLGKDWLLPLVTAKLREDTKFTLFDLAHKLREHGWTIPVYRLPPNADNVVAMRVVVRESFSRDTAEMLLKHINEACALFERYPPPSPAKELSNVAPEKANRSQHVC